MVFFGSEPLPEAHAPWCVRHGANSAAINTPLVTGLSKWLCTMMASVSGSPCSRAPRVRQPNTTRRWGF